MKAKTLIPILLAMFMTTGSFTALSAPAKEKKKTKKTVVVKKKAKKTSAVIEESANKTITWKAYPDTVKTKDKAKLLVERETPKTVRMSEEYTYILRVVNQSYYQIDDVTVTEKLPENFTMIKAVPKPEMRGKDLKWDLGLLASGQKVLINITGKVDKPGRVYHTGSAKASFGLNKMIAIMEVVEPSLEMKAVAPSEVIVSEVFPVKLHINNIGSANVIDAKLDHTLPKDMVSSDGASTLSIDVGDIDPGQTKTIDLLLKANKVGTYNNTFVVKAKDGVSASATLKTSVRKPKLKLVATAPKMRFVGNVIKYDIKVNNVGDGDAKNMVTKLKISGGTAFESANEGGRLQGNNTVVWNTKSLEPKETKELIARIRAKEIMDKATAVVSTEAIAAQPLEVTLDTRIEGIAALLLQVGDINDPVPIGQTETYVITVTNQGSLPATNIKMSCELENSMEYVKSTGPTKPVGEEGDAKKGGSTVKPTKSMDSSKKEIVEFGTLKSLAPKQDAVWRVEIRALKEGDFRFNVRIISDQLSRPVNENESTTFYKD